MLFQQLSIEQVRETYENPNNISLNWARDI